MKEKTSKLLLEYMNNTGKTIEFGNVDSADEFLNWYKNRRQLASEFRSFLEFNGFDISSSDCLEVGTNMFNSLVIPFNTAILTEDPDLFDSSLDRRIIPGKLVVKDDRLFIAKKENDNTKYIDISDDELTLLSHNVLNPVELLNWEKIHNLKLGDILVGAFGNMDDKDRVFKLTMLKKLRKSLEDYDYLENHFVSNNMYLYVLGSSSKLNL